MEKLNELSKNREFIDRLAKLETDVDVENLLKEYGINLSESEFEEFINKLNLYIENNGEGELTEESLEAVSGGFGVVAAAAVVVIGGTLVTAGSIHTYKRIKNESSCLWKGESAYPNNPFYTCR